MKILLLILFLTGSLSGMKPVQQNPLTKLLFDQIDNISQELVASQNINTLVGQLRYMGIVIQDNHQLIIKKMPNKEYCNNLEKIVTDSKEKIYNLYKAQPQNMTLPHPASTPEESYAYMSQAIAQTEESVECLKKALSEKENTRV